MTSHSCWCCRVALCIAPFVTIRTVSHSGLTRQDAVKIPERLAEDSADCIRRMAFISLAVVITHQPNGSEKVDALRKTLDEKIRVPGHFFTVDACPEGQQAVPCFWTESSPCHLFEQRFLWTKTSMDGFSLSFVRTAEFFGQKPACCSTACTLAELAFWVVDYLWDSPVLV